MNDPLIIYGAIAFFAAPLWGSAMVYSARATLSTIIRAVTPADKE